MLKWIVLDENPKPDNYIAIIMSDEARKLKIHIKACSIFDEEYKAICHAKDLRKQHNVKSIRIFYIDGCSKIIC
ncbi:hypothetical protein BH09BAC3_BH09BAC3_23820 [soil metagenome]